MAMPLPNGLEVTHKLIKEVPSARVLVLSSYSDDEYIRQATEAGAAGYLLKQTAAADLIRAIREARNGNAYFSPAISKQILENYRDAFFKGAPVGTRVDRLTSREAEV